MPVDLSGLRARLVLLILLGLLPVALLSIYMIGEQRRSAEQAAEQDALRLARLAASRYAQLADHAAQWLGVAAKLPELRGGDERACSAALTEVLRGQAVHAALLVIDVTGRVHCEGRGANTAAVASDAALLRRAVEHGGFVIGHYAYDSEPRRPVVHAAYAIPATDKVLYTAIDLSWVHALAAEALLPPQATLSVFDAQGVMLARYPAAPDVIGTHLGGTPMGGLIMAAAEEGTAAATGVDGVPRLYGYTPLAFGQGNKRIYIAVGVPERQAFAAVHKLLRTAIIGAFVVALIAWLAIWKGADRLVLGKVRALVAATRRLTTGDLAARSGVQRQHGEIGELAHAFDRMAVTLQARAEESARAQAALKQSEERFRRLAENAPDVIYRYALYPVRGFEYVSPAATAITGYTPEEHYDDPDLGRKLVHPDDAPLLERLLRGETEPTSIEIRWVRRDGAVIWTEQRNVLVRDTSGRLVAVEGIARDITERKRAEQELRLLQTITLAVGAAEDLDGALRIVMQRVCEVTGWVLGQAWVQGSDGVTLVCSNAWYSRAPGLESFRAHSQSWQVRQSGNGLLARAWRTRAPVWVRDVATEPKFSRAEHAQGVGLHAAMAVPVLVGNDLEAVIEFYMSAPRLEDEHLVRTVAGVAAQLGSVIRQKRSEARLVYLAHHDLMTDLPNRTLFHDRLQQAIREADRYERLVAVVFLDLDRFKTINDSLGHEIGDRLLRAVAERLSACVRAVDTVARLSGDEFTIVLPDLGHVDDAARVAEKIVEHFRQPFMVSGVELYISASIGITLYPFDDTDTQGLLRNADVAMYRAKAKGRNTYEFYTAEMTVQVQEQLALEGALRRALERNEFVLEYQPVVNVHSGRIVGAEALLRWRHPARGLIPPAQFIPLAEETGLIVPIGAWVLATACAQAAAWRAAGYAPLRLAVNISARQFMQPGLIETVQAALADSGFDGAALELEITESLLMQNVESTLHSLAALHRMGVHLSIDDFGTGYSSLSYLKRFAIDRLKIDRSFVKDIPRDADGAAITNAIIAIAHKLGLEVVAEGVETPEQVAFLCANGCDVMQGFYYSRPLAADALTRLLAEGTALAPMPLSPRAMAQGGD